MKTRRTLAALLAAFLMSTSLASHGATALQGELGGTVSADRNGAFTYSVDLQVPRAADGSEPALALSYSSQGGTGLSGVGWSLNGLSNIYRCPATPAQDGVRGTIAFDQTDRFCIDGQRLVAIGNTAGNHFSTDDQRAQAYGQSGTIYHTELETWRKIISNGNCNSGACSFDVVEADGTRISYGQTADSSFAGANGLQRSWVVNQKVDRQGNLTLFTYMPSAQSAGAVYPLAISYGGHIKSGVVDQSPTRRITFDYQTRPDTIVSFESGVQTTTTQRLSNISMSGLDPKRAYQYRLEYASAPDMRHSLVASITFCGLESTCLQPDRFDYSVTRDIQSPRFSASTASPIANGQPTLLVGDIAGNGKETIVLVANSGLPICNGSRVAMRASDSDELTCLSNAFPLLGANVSLADVNSDGRADLVMVWPAGAGDKCPHPGAIGVAYSNGSGFGPLECLGQLKGSLDTFAFAATSGTGFPDLIVWNAEISVKGSHCAIGQVSIVRASLRDGGENVLDTLSCLSLPGTGQVTNLVTTDVNGDGLADILVQTTPGSFANCGANSLQVFVSAGAGAFNSTCQSVPGLDMNGVQQLIPQDIDGDRLVDLIIMSPQVLGICKTTNVAAFVSDGAGFTPAICLPTLSSTTLLSPIGDLNGDGLPDLMRRPLPSDTCASSRQFAIYYGTGTGYTDAQCLFPVANVTTAIMELVDLDGDGLRDFVTLGQAGNRSCTANNLCIQHQQTEKGNTLAQARFPTLLRSVANGLGGSVEATYGRMVDPDVYSAGSKAWQYPQRADITSLPLIAKLVRKDGRENSYGISYAYAGAAIDLSGRGWLGFGQRTETDIQSQVQEVLTLNQPFPYTGTVNSWIRRCTGAANSYDPKCVNQPSILESLLYGDTDANNGYGCVDLDQVPCGLSTRNFVVNLMQKTRQVFNYGALLYSAKVTFTYDAYGQPLVESDLGDPSTPGQAVYRCTTPWYPADLLKEWLIGLISEIRVSSTADCQSPLRDVVTSFTDDGRYNYANVKSWDNSAAQPRWLTTAYRYDDFGNVIEQASPDQTVVSTYDTATSSYIESQAVQRSGIPPLTQRFIHDDLFGAQIGRIDFNGNKHITCLDSVGRTRAQQGPAPAGQIATDPSCQPGVTTSDMVTLATLSQGNDRAGGVFLQRLERPTWGRVDGSWSSSREYLDGLGRQWQDEGSFLDMDGANSTISTTAFSPQGSIASETLPQVAGAPSRSNQYEYDAYGRTIKITASDGTVTLYDYNPRSTGTGQSTTTTYPDGTKNPQQITHNYDARERLESSVFTDDAGMSFTTTYTYDLLNRPVTVATADLAVKRTYDSLDRLLTESTTDGAIKTYAYNAHGQLETISDSSGTVVYSYDGVGRTASIAQSNGQITTLTYDEEGHANGLGEVTTIAIESLISPNGYPATSSLAYTPYGQIASSTELVAGRRYETRLDYLPSGETAGTVHPDGSRVALSYYLGGLPRATEYFVHAQDHTPRAAISYNSYTGDGRILSATLTGNASVQRVTGYEAATGLPVSLQTGTAQQPASLENLAFQYDSRARLTKILDTARLGGVDASQTFSYDRLNRLSTAIGPYGSKQYSFSNSGALTQKDGQTLTNKGDQLVSGTDSVATTFATNGNLTGLTYGGQGLGFDYDPLGRLTGLSAGGAQKAQYGYGLHGGRKLKIVGDTRTFYSDAGFAESRTADETSTVTHFPNIGGVTGYALTQAGVTAVRFMLEDHLGSVTQVLTEDGTTQSLWNYDPFGQSTVVISPGLEPVGPIFAGIEQDRESGLLYAVNRYYDPRTGRFLTPDPALGANGAGDPAQLNRYSYVSGNPINSIDPLGLFDIPVAGNALDAAFAVSDLASVAFSPGDSSNWLALAGDVAAAIVPTVPDGAGKLMKAGVVGAERARDLHKGIDVARASGETRAASGVTHAENEIEAVSGSGAMGMQEGCFSFAAGTPVSTSNGGSRSIEKLRVGDVVLSGTEDGTHTSRSLVTALHRRQACDLLNLKTADGSVAVTAEHPFLVRSGDKTQWRTAGTLVVGDALISLRGHDSTVMSVENLNDCAQVFNFTAEPLHTYAVGSDQVLTHNQHKSRTFCTLTYDSYSKTVIEKWNLSRWRRQARDIRNDIEADIIRKSNALQAGISSTKLKRIGVVKKRVDTASYKWLQDQAQEKGISLKGISQQSKKISKLAALIRPLKSRLDQDVDEIIPRFMGGKTIMQGFGNNQMLLVSVVNREHGRVYSRLARSLVKSGKELVIRNIQTVVDY